MDNDDDSKYKSKNLNAERRRRKKLSDRQLELRALVPIITNERNIFNNAIYFLFGFSFCNNFIPNRKILLLQMNKATIITDAIAYIEELKTCVEVLSNKLLQMEATSFGEEKIKVKESDVEQDINKLGIRPAEADAEVEVNHFSGTKLWIKMVFEKKRGALTKLMAAISVLGIDLNDTSITTSRGAVLFTTFGEGTRGGLPEAEQMKKYLLEIIRST